ncbi:uncharacterized protein LOC141531712 isoform X2 [Cotesia typhae]|uniref:uncharacterized protein LOC141531712 isoform X2 n=1 Tax=Cotesia typhae TaxID=2053667 RepID=UPI003D6810EE
MLQGINYYAIPRRGNEIQAYEAILTSYNRWVKFSELAFDLYGYLEHLSRKDYVCADVCEKYIALATTSKIFIYINLKQKPFYSFVNSPSISYVIKEVKFGYYTDEDDNNHLYIVATFESGDSKAWMIHTDDDDYRTTNWIDTKQIKNSEPKYKNLCSGTARNFYSSSNLEINKHTIRDKKMKIECSIDLSKKKEDSKKSSERMTTFSNEIVALDSNDMNIYAVTCRVDKNLDSTVEELFLERFVCQDVLLICTKGGIAYDRKYCYEPLPKEFNSNTKVYLTMEDFIICTCGKYIAVYDDPLNEWIVRDLIDDDHYVTTLIVHVNLLLVGFNTGEIFGYDVSVTQFIMKPNFFNGPKFKISEIRDPIIAFKVFEQQLDESDLKRRGISEDQRKNVYYPYILIISSKDSYVFRFTNNFYETITNSYLHHYVESHNTLPKIERCDIHKDDHYTFVSS